MLIDKIKDNAKKNCARIGVGIGRNKENILKSIFIAEKKNYAKIIKFDSPKLLIQCLEKGEIDAGIRGSFSAKPALNELKNTFELDQLFRLAILQSYDGKIFFLAPVGIDEGKGIENKIEIIKLGAKFLKRLEIKPKIAVLSGGRLEDIGRGEYIDFLINEGIKLENIFINKKPEVKHFGILIEEAIKHSNFLIAPNGIYGNYIFRTLCFLGGGKAIGAPVLNIDKIYIDTSSSKKDYTLSIALASSLV